MTLLAPADRVQESAANIGAVSPVTLLGAQDNRYIAFPDSLDGETIPYTIEHRTSGQWEVGYGVFDATARTLTREAVLSNSSETTSPINFQVGVVDVWIDAPAEKVVLFDADSWDLHLDEDLFVGGDFELSGSAHILGDLDVEEDALLEGDLDVGGATWLHTTLTVTGVSNLISGTLRTLTFGAFLTGGSFNSSANVTLATNATAVNTASTLVARDASGNFAAGTITATLNGSAPAISLTGTTLAPNVVNSSLETLGTVTSGTWTATTIAVTRGGTGLTGYAIGDTLYASGTTTLAKLAIGTGLQVYRTNAGATAPEWHTLVPGDITNAAALTKSDDTNVTLTLGGSPSVALLAATSITVGWTGTLAAARLNANVPQAVTNDTNVTGSIAAQILTLGWTGTLAAARLNANVVQVVSNDTNVTGSIGTQTLTLAWSGQLGVTRGGTSFSGYAIGDTIYASGTTTLAKLTIGAANTVYTSSGTAPQWSANLAYATLPTGSGSWDTGAATTITITRSMTVSGTLTATLTGSITGNAATATALQTPRNINGVAFDGTANITVTAAAGTLTGTTLAANVVTSSLTTVATLLQLDVANNITATRASGTSVDLLLVQTGVATWRVRNTATSGLFAIGDTTGAFFTLAVTTGAFAFTGAGAITGALTLTAGTAATLTFGAHMTGTSYNSSANVTIATDAASANTVSTIVARDGSGNFAAGTITAALTGNASTATALATPRAIWGQNFDGTAAVNGAMTGVTTIAASGDYTLTKASGATPALVLVQTSVATWTLQNTATSGQFRIAQGAGTSFSLDLTTHAAVLAGSLAIATTVSFTGGTFTTSFISTTALATPSSIGATQFTAFASTVSGATLMGYGTTYDVALKARGGATALGVLANTIDVAVSGNLSMPGSAIELTVGSGGGNSGITLTQDWRLRRNNATGTLQFDNSGNVRFSMTSAGALQLPNYGAGAATFDSSGNITSVSDERCKTDIEEFRRGLESLRGIRPITHRWREGSGETVHRYPGFSAQNVREFIPEAVFAREGDGLLSLYDRGLLATVVNATLDLDQRVTALEARNN